MGVVDENEADLPILKVQALDDLGDRTLPGDIEGDGFGPFFKVFQCTDSFDVNNHGCGFQVPGCRLRTIRNGGLAKRGGLFRSSFFLCALCGLCERPAFYFLLILSAASLNPRERSFSRVGIPLASQPRVS
jgi:hypothetical protein